MRSSLHHCGLSLLAAISLAACGRPAPLLDEAQAQPAISVTAHPAPLSEAEITQYLQVMREAAQRVQHPTAAERQMLARADAITAAANRGEAMAGANEGDVLTQALAFRMQMDLQVARAHHLEPARYQALSERIEDESGELYCAPGAPVPDALLKPHVAEIEHLIGIVRNPGAAGSTPIPPACAHQ